MTRAGQPHSPRAPRPPVAPAGIGCGRPATRCNGLSRADWRRALAALVVAALATACEPAFDCQAPVDAEGLELSGDGAGATMESFCSGYTLGVEIDSLVVHGTRIQRLELPCLCGVTQSVEITDNSELVDLGGLGRVRAIGGGLVVARNPRLATLTGLPTNAAVGVAVDESSIVIEDNDALVDLAGLPAAGAELQGDLQIVGNERLASLSALPPALTRVRGLRIDGNPALKSLEGLPPGLATIGEGGLVIAANHGLHDLGGLPPGLARVDGSLEIRANDRLEQLAGVPAALVTVGGDLEISGNLALRDLSGLPDDLRVGGLLDIRNDDRLVDLSGLPAQLQLGVQAETGDSLRVLHNDGLLDLSGLPAGITELAGSARIVGNPDLADLSGLFEHVRKIGGALEIGENHALVDLDGLPDDLQLGVDRQGLSLVVAENQGLEFLTGFPPGLAALPGGLAVLQNRNLRDLTGLEPLRHVVGDLVIGRRRVADLDLACSDAEKPGGNGSMQTLTGLSALERVDGTLAIACNPALTALDAFASLQTVDGSLILRENPGLTDIAGLGGPDGALTHVGGVFELRCSPLLDLEAAVAVLDHVDASIPTVLDLACP
ncbi:hypothetical protein [Nannocystis punicea]|uniref:Receptor L domain-containing protein n=1 Tax=Nannocystis punicea TaxID=2995304 RepID=A0ABY7HJ88_9BACT|nr:hypothetical protein [Nannocystis poenicansa]WAS99100.1 hypothetical protein O0S08_23470 [Nannocystis poenicansa]